MIVDFAMNDSESKVGKRGRIADCGSGIAEWKSFYRKDAKSAKVKREF
jgi:hypothetical protein